MSLLASLAELFSLQTHAAASQRNAERKTLMRAWVNASVSANARLVHATGPAGACSSVHLGRPQDLSVWHRYGVVRRAAAAGRLNALSAKPVVPAHLGGESAKTAGSLGATQARGRLVTGAWSGAGPATAVATLRI